MVDFTPELQLQFVILVIRDFTAHLEHQQSNVLFAQQEHGQPELKVPALIALLTNTLFQVLLDVSPVLLETTFFNLVGLLTANNVLQTATALLSKMCTHPVDQAEHLLLAQPLFLLAFLTVRLVNTAWEPSVQRAL